MELPLPLLLLAVAVRAIIILSALVLGIRSFGRRDVGGLNLIDLVMVLLIGNAVQNALTYGSGHLAVGIVSAGTLLVLDRALGILFVRRPWLERKLFGEPTVLVTDGRFDDRALRRESVSEDEVLAAAREQGLAKLSDVRLAVLEPDGTISIIPRDNSRGGH